MNPFRWIYHFLALDVLFGSRNGKEPCEVDAFDVTKLDWSAPKTTHRFDMLGTGRAVLTDGAALDRIASMLDLRATTAPSEWHCACCAIVSGIVSETGRTVRTPETATEAVVIQESAERAVPRHSTSIMCGLDKHEQCVAGASWCSCTCHVQQALDRAFIRREPHKRINVVEVAERQPDGSMRVYPPVPLDDYVAAIPVTHCNLCGRELSTCVCTF